MAYGKATGNANERTRTIGIVERPVYAGAATNNTSARVTRRFHALVFRRRFAGRTASSVINRSLSLSHRRQTTGSSREARRRRGWSLNCTADVDVFVTILAQRRCVVAFVIGTVFFPERSVFRSLCASERSFQVTLDRLSILHGERGRTSKRYNAPPPSFAL